MLIKYLKNVLFIGELNFSNYLQTPLTDREKQEDLTAQYFTKSKPRYQNSILLVVIILYLFITGVYCFRNIIFKQRFLFPMHAETEKYWFLATDVLIYFEKIKNFSSFKNTHNVYIYVFLKIVSVKNIEPSVLPIVSINFFFFFIK